MDIFTVTPLLDEKKLPIITIRVLKKPRLSKSELKSESIKPIKSVESAESGESVTFPESVSASAESPFQR